MRLPFKGRHRAAVKRLAARSGEEGKFPIGKACCGLRPTRLAKLYHDLLSMLPRYDVNVGLFTLPGLEFPIEVSQDPCTIVLSELLCSRCILKMYPNRFMRRSGRRLARMGDPLRPRRLHCSRVGFQPVPSWSGGLFCSNERRRSEDHNRSECPGSRLARCFVRTASVEPLCSRR